MSELSGRPVAYLHLRGPALAGSGPGIAEAVSVSRLFIANPDLVSRFALGQGLAGSDPGTHYSGGARGYVDYPIWPAA